MYVENKDIIYTQWQVWNGFWQEKSKRDDLQGSLGI